MEFSIEDTARLSGVRSQLVERRQRLRTYIAEERKTPQLIELVKAVDAALERIEDGSYGICDVCNDPIETRYLDADPLVKICLSHLSAEQQRAIERDLALAAQIQGKLLPVVNTHIPGWEMIYRYEPLGPVSGDYCDLVKPESGAGDMHLFFGDVSGKGVAASLLMSHLHGIFRSLLPSDLPLPRLVERANRLFSESTSSTNFATLVCARFTPAGDLELCNAGHCFPLVIQSGQIRSIESTGLPLGIFFSAEYQSRTIRLAEGDTLVLYTDGMTEARNPAGDEYSEARLSALIAREHLHAPHDLVKICLDDLSQFRAGTPKTDDLTVLIMRRMA